VRIVFEVEGDIGSLALEQDRRLAPRVRIAHFIENVAVRFTHFGDYDVGPFNLVLQPLHNWLSKDLLVHAFAVRAGTLDGGFYSEGVEIIEPLTKRHEYKNKRLGSSIRHVFSSFA
jgi:hypothetical protein